MTTRAADRDASERFYATVLAPLGIEPTYAGAELVEWEWFAPLSLQGGPDEQRR